MTSLLLLLTTTTKVVSSDRTTSNLVVAVMQRDQVPRCHPNCPPTQAQAILTLMHHVRLCCPTQPAPCCLTTSSSSTCLQGLDLNKLCWWEAVAGGKPGAAGCSRGTAKGRARGSNKHMLVWVNAPPPPPPHPTHNTQGTCTHTPTHPHACHSSGPPGTMLPVWATGVWGEHDCRFPPLR